MISVGRMSRHLKPETICHTEVSGVRFQVSVSGDACRVNGVEGKVFAEYYLLPLPAGATPNSSASRTSSATDCNPSLAMRLARCALMVRSLVPRS